MNLGYLLLAAKQKVYFNNNTDMYMYNSRKHSREKNFVDQSFRGMKKKDV